MFASNRCHGSARNWCATHASRHTEKYASPCSPIVLAGWRIRGYVLISAMATKNATTSARRLIGATVARGIRRTIGTEALEQRTPGVEKGRGQALQHRKPERDRRCRGARLQAEPDEERKERRREPSRGHDSAEQQRRHQVRHDEHCVGPAQTTSDRDCQGEGPDRRYGVYEIVGKPLDVGLQTVLRRELGRTAQGREPAVAAAPGHLLLRPLKRIA